MAIWKFEVFWMVKENCTLIANTDSKKSVSHDCEDESLIDIKSLIKRQRIGNILKHVLFVSLLTVFAVGCQKNEFTEPDISEQFSKSSAIKSAKEAPVVVDAGDDKRIVYPESSASLSGTGSSTQGRTITYLWHQVRGNSTAVISQPTQPTTNVSKLVPGLYIFTLTVEDEKGVLRTDSTSISVLEKVTWNVEGVVREALIHPSTGGSKSAPIIFAFHGHGGTDLGFAERDFEVNWPEAIVVYPQGLPTNGSNNKADAGWQHSVGEIDENTGDTDEDIKFFDVMLSTLKKNYKGDLNWVFTHGWSDGGNFVYNVLWSARAEKLAAISPAGATLETTSNKQSIPVIHVAGTSDSKVKFSSQQKSVQQVRALNNCSSTGTTWATGRNGILGTKYASPTGDNVVLLQYDGDHAYPFTIPPYIVQFFREVAGK